MYKTNRTFIVFINPNDPYQTEGCLSVDIQGVRLCGLITFALLSDTTFSFSNGAK